MSDNEKKRTFSEIIKEYIDSLPHETVRLDVFLGIVEYARADERQKTLDEVRKLIRKHEQGECGCMKFNMYCWETLDKEVSKLGGGKE